MKLRHLLPALLLGALSLAPASSRAFVDISINIAPPVLPVYEQPLCPQEGYLWTPGYWGYGDEGYYWVPGVWVEPPQVGFLWTPGYWGYRNNLYVFNDGYWGPTVGFYGGVNYGYGYGGSGYYGGRWEGDAFRYNTAVTRVNTTIIHNTYVDKTVIRESASGRGASFNGPGGVKAEPTAEQLAAARGAHVQATSAQAAHEQNAAKNRQLLASVNHGHPAQAAIRSLPPATHIGTPAAESHPPAQAHPGNPGGQPFADARDAHPNRDGLSADERKVISHRQQRLDRANAAAHQPAEPSREEHEQAAPRRTVENRDMARQTAPGGYGEPVRQSANHPPVVHQQAPPKHESAKPEHAPKGEEKHDKKHPQPQ